MKHVWKMLMAALLACMLLLSVASAAEGTLYGETNRKDVPAMNTASLTGNTVFTLSKGYEFVIIQTVVDDAGDAWYVVHCTHPDNGSTYQVYIYADDVTAGITPDTNEAEDYVPGDDEDSGIQDSTDSALGNKYDITEKDFKAETDKNLGLYKEPDTDSNMLVTIPAETVVDVTGQTTVSGRSWYRVVYNGKTGFVPAAMVTQVTEEVDERLELPKVADGVIVNTNGVNFREEPDKSSESMGKLKAGVEVELLSIPDDQTDANSWYMVRYDGKVGYINAPYVQVKGADAGDDDAEADEEDEKIVGFGMIQNTDGVKFREGPGTNYDYEITLPSGTLVSLLSIPEDRTSKGWFKVIYEGEKGYINAPYVSVIGETEDDGADEEEDDVTPTLPEGEDKLHDGVIQNTNGVKFREGPGTNYAYEITLPAGTEVEVLSPLPAAYDSEHWFKVFYNGQVGYIQAPYVYIQGVTDAEDDATGDAEEDDEIDPDTVIVRALGVIQNTNGVNFREKPDVNSTSMGKLKSGVIVEVVEYAAYNSADYWFTVLYNGKVGYIQAPYVHVNGLNLQTPPAGVEPEKPEEDEDSDVIAKGEIVNTNGVNFRKKADKNSDSIMKLKSGVKVDILDIPTDPTDEDSWYKVSYAGYTGYIMSPYVKVLVDGEEDDSDEEDTPAADVIGKGVITSTNGVNLREYASVNSTSLGKLAAGDNVQLLKIPSGTDANSWFKVRVNGKDGYVQAPYVVVLEGVIPDSGDTDDVVGVGVVTSTNGVNFRTGASKEYSSMGKIPGDTSVELLSIPSSVGDDYWYKVRYNGKKGYVQSTYIRVVSVEAGALPDADEYGYAKLLQSSANLRDAAAGNTVVSWKGKGSLLRIAGDSITNGYYEWIPVFYPADSAIYYVRADMVQIVLVEDGQIVTPSPAPASRYGYVLATGNVNLRIQPDEESIAQIPKGTILVCIDDPVDPQGSSYTWYEVKYNGMYGFVRGDYVTVCDKNGNPIDEEGDTDTGDEDVTDTIYGYIKVVPLVEGNRVNLRESPVGGRIGLLDEGLILPMIDEVIPAGHYGQYSWYKVRTADGLAGYVRGDCLVECDKNGNPTVTEPDDEDEVNLGYVMVTGNNVYVRQSPFGVGVGNVQTNEVWPITGASKTASGVTWYYIEAYDEGKKIEGYIHGDYVYKLTDAEAAKYEADPTYRPSQDKTPVGSGKYVITVNTNGLNLRDSYSQDSTSRYKVGSGVVMEYIATKEVGTVTWYNIIYKDIELWAHGDYLEEMTDTEYKAWLAENPDFEPDADDFLGYVRTLQDSVAIRNAANGSVKIETIAKEDTVLRYYTQAITAGGVDWYRVYTPTEKFGYIRADMVQKCDKDGNPIVPDYTTSAGNSQQETTYTTLRKGSKGVAVTNLVTELINQGYYTGKVTSEFTTAVKDAVEAFQYANGLDADGIADSTTQHKLFGTVPIGAGNTSNYSFTIYPVEKIDWFTGGIQEMLPRGANFKIYDVKTGIVWWAHRWAGAYHADIETLTRADTNRLCTIYGVDDLEEIVERNMWERRPCLVTIGTRTFACSLDGMQHNPDGDTIGNNGMDGQICLHFTNSWGHASGEVSESHSEAIQYAYKFDYSDRSEYRGE